MAARLAKGRPAARPRPLPRARRASPSATPISGRAAPISSAPRRLPLRAAGVGYDINRAAPLIAGVDWRLDNGIVAGVAATYVATSASFKDGSRTNVSSYQGAAYAGWAGGPVVRLGKRRRELQRFRHLAASHPLRPSGRRHLVTLGGELSGPCGRRLSLGAARRRHHDERHALRGFGLRERACLGLFRDGRLRRAFGECGRWQLL